MHINIDNSQNGGLQTVHFWYYRSLNYRRLNKSFQKHL